MPTTFGLEVSCDRDVSWEDTWTGELAFAENYLAGPVFLSRGGTAYVNVTTRYYDGIDGRFLYWPSGSGHRMTAVAPGVRPMFGEIRSKRTRAGFPQSPTRIFLFIILPFKTAMLRSFYLLSSIVLLISTGASACTSAPDQSEGDDGRVLFDGRSFDGWEGNLDMFRIEDEAIVAGTLAEPIPRNEFLCTTSEYDDFELHLEFRLLGGESANAGVQFRSQRIPDHHEVIGYQADMGDGWWGALYDESRRNRILAAPDSAGIESALLRGGWNDYVIRADGRRIRLAINGHETVDYVEPDEDIPLSGKICLQIHSGSPSEAWYRNISIRE